MKEIRKVAAGISLVLEWKKTGDDYVASLTGGDEHVGAVGVGFYDPESKRASSSVITSPGHRETEIALNGAKEFSKACKATSVFIVGIHLDNITLDEINEIVSASGEMINELAVIIGVGEGF
ncbi:MAG: hypothetical protein PWQ51_1212 [Methanolobus sp.]|jgi:hypothetical protein|uniref:Prenylated flavin chaperone LpdD-like domain-containing protein n=1 Tax=Methanolobus tindarius DSM 2278 TaxID=1090322 RepID=W9DQN3_METTI|nr:MULTISPECIES: hypothetical protein [Methanolobus]ETA67670.1 hypothetical protein MettiDRAFT_1098 [Methanolobus tindarius DSM 2278]MDK2832479.1 hypothetical protein [Methanolobus sp.]MDK2939048.1 hypothetical protein [Methanolobus sp.]